MSLKSFFDLSSLVKNTGNINNDDRKKIVEILIQRGNKLLSSSHGSEEFTQNPRANNLLENLKKYPHAFVLACVMDRQIKAERAWLIPYKISEEIGGFGFSKLLSLKQKRIKEIFKRRKLHRFNEVMANNFYLAIQKIHKDYNDKASDIWKNRPRSATVVKRFLQFKGVGVKISTMAVNILARKFKIPMQDHICIDISPDVHVKRVFKRLGFITKNANNDELIYCARELNPKYPGIFDLSAWQIGRNWCHPKKPNCKECYLNKYCPKVL